MESGKYRKGKINLEEVGKEAAQKWRDLTDRERKHYEELAYLDACRYRREMEEYSESKEKRRERERKQFEEDAYYEKKSSGDDSRKFEIPSSGHHHQPSWYNPSRSAPQGYEFNFAASQLPPMAYGHTDIHPYATAIGMNRNQIFGTHPHAMPQVHPPLPLPPHASQLQFPNALEDARSSLPMPPGMEVVIPDRDGFARRYRVKYACFSMTREAAMKYMQDLTGDSSEKFSEATAEDFGVPPASGASSTQQQPR
jgi:hypothetical protein